MNKKQRYIVLTVGAISVLFLLYNYHQSPERSLLHQAKIKVLAGFGTSTVPSSQVLDPVNKIPPTVDCPESTLEKIAATCDISCLFQHIQKRDPELVIMMEELRKIPEKPKTNIGNFYHAFFNIEADPTAREKSLRELSRKDPDNAYPMFFLGDVVTNYREEDAKAIYREGLLRRKYESYFTQYFRRLKAATIDDRAVYARAFLFNNSLNIHQMNTSVLWSLRDLDEKLAKEVAMKILEPTIRLNGEFADILWNREDYLMSRQMLAAVDSTEESLLPEFEVEEMVLEKYSPGLLNECTVNSFLEERERERVRLSKVK